MIPIDDALDATWHALRRSSEAADCPATRVAGRSRPWWSATFAGHRVALTLLAASGDALDAWLATLAEADLPLAGRIVADCAIDHVASTERGIEVALSLLVLDQA